MALRLRYSDKTIVLPVGQLFVGRSPECHIVTHDPQASRRHAVFTMGKTGAFVTDLQSKAGVLVNGELVTGAKRLARGDRVALAGLQIVVEAVTADTEDEPTDPRLRATMAPPSAATDAPVLRLRPTPPLGIARVDASRALDTMNGDEDDDLPPSSAGDDSLGRTQEAQIPLALQGSARAQEAAARPPPLPPLAPPPSAPRSSHESGFLKAQELSLTHTQEAPRVVLPPDPGGRASPASSSRHAGDVASGRIPRLAPPPSFPREGTLRALAAVGEKAIALGRSEEAERILQRALLDSLEGARRGELDAPTAELAASLAARLAASTGSGRWFDFAVAVYVARGELAPAPVVDLLYAAVGRVRPVDKGTFREYLAAVRGKSVDSPARRFVIQRLEGLQRILELK